MASVLFNNTKQTTQSATTPIYGYLENESCVFKFAFIS